MIRRINNNERDILMSSYAITDIYNIIWTFIRYAIERSSMNLYLFVDCTNGLIIIKDDGESINLQELKEQSLFIKCLKSIASVSIKSTCTKLGLFAEEYKTGDGTIKKCEVDGIYRNSFSVSNLFTTQRIRVQCAIDGLSRFEHVLKCVMIENDHINWKYDREGMNLTISCKSKALRARVLFDKNIMIEKDKTIEGIKYKTCMSFLKSTSIHNVPVILNMGLPREVEQAPIIITNNRYILYINDILEMYGKCTTRTNETNTTKLMKYSRIEMASSSANFSEHKFKEHFNISARIKVENISEQSTNAQSQSRGFLKDLVVVGQFDNKSIVAKRKYGDLFEIWLFDQHACDERIKLEELVYSSVSVKYSIDEIKTRACKTAIKFGDCLLHAKQEEILRKLSECREPFHCAHGRPTCWLLARISN